MGLVNTLFKKRYILAIFPLIMLSAAGQGYADSSNETFQWVADRLSVAHTGKMPVIHFVDKDKLHIVFEKNNRKSYLRWEARYGVAKAKEILSVYLQEIIGLFDPTTKAVYVANWLNPCRQQSTLSHEITHFFQYQTRPLKNQSEAMAANQRLKWEIEAHQIENAYVQEHCPQQATD